MNHLEIKETVKILSSAAGLSVSYYCLSTGKREKIRMQQILMLGCIL